MLYFVDPNSSKAAFGSHWLYLEASLLSAQPLDHPCVSWLRPVQLLFQPTQSPGSLTSTHLAITNTILPCPFPVLPDPQDLLTFSCSKTQILVWKPPWRTQCHQAWSCCHPWFSLYAREQACIRAPTHTLNHPFQAGQFPSAWTWHAYSCLDAWLFKSYLSWSSWRSPSSTFHFSGRPEIPKPCLTHFAPDLVGHL